MLREPDISFQQSDQASPVVVAPESVQFPVLFDRRERIPGVAGGRPDGVDVSVQKNGRPVVRNGGFHPEIVALPLHLESLVPHPGLQEITGFLLFAAEGRNPDQIFQQLKSIHDSVVRLRIGLDGRSRTKLRRGGNDNPADARIDGVEGIL